MAEDSYDGMSNEQLAKHQRMMADQLERRSALAQANSAVTHQTLAAEHKNYKLAARNDASMPFVQQPPTPVNIPITVTYPSQQPAQPARQQHFGDIVGAPVDRTASEHAIQQSREQASFAVREQAANEAHARQARAENPKRGTKRSSADDDDDGASDNAIADAVVARLEAKFEKNKTARSGDQEEGATVHKADGQTLAMERFEKKLDALVSAKEAGSTAATTTKTPPSAMSDDPDEDVEDKTAPSPSEKDSMAKASDMATDATEAPASGANAPSLKVLLQQHTDVLEQQKKINSIASALKKLKSDGDAARSRRDELARERRTFDKIAKEYQDNYRAHCMEMLASLDLSEQQAQKSSLYKSIGDHAYGKLNESKLNAMAANLEMISCSSSKAASTLAAADAQFKRERKAAQERADRAEQKAKESDENARRLHDQVTKLQYQQSRWNSRQAVHAMDPFAKQSSFAPSQQQQALAASFGANASADERPIAADNCRIEAGTEFADGNVFRIETASSARTLTDATAASKTASVNGKRVFVGKKRRAIKTVTAMGANGKPVTFDARVKRFTTRDWSKHDFALANELRGMGDVDSLYNAECFRKPTEDTQLFGSVYGDSGILREAQFARAPRY